MASYELKSGDGKGFDVTSAAYRPGHDDLVDEAHHTDAVGVQTGTEADALDMARLGRTQELRRNFKSLSVLGLSVTTMSTWVALLLTNTFALINGGLAGMIWTYLASWVFTFALASSIAEMASMVSSSTCKDCPGIGCATDRILHRLQLRVDNTTGSPSLRLVPSKSFSPTSPDGSRLSVGKL